MSTSDSPAKLIYQPVLGYIEQTAAKSAAPGGGSAAALSGALGSALLTMVVNFTVGKSDYASVSQRFTELRSKVESLRAQLTDNVDLDTDAFNRYRVANKLPERDEAERVVKVQELAVATHETIRVPHSTMTYCLAAMEFAPDIARHGNVNTVSDAGTGAELLLAGLEGAALNVLINLSGLPVESKAKWRTDVDEARRRGRALLNEVRGILEQKLNG